MIQKIISVVFQWNLNFDIPTAEALGLSRRLLVRASEMDFAKKIATFRSECS